MAKGPFGNPLSTGIALSGVIDMVTPVRQAQERKRKRQAEEKAAQDKRAKELGSIMGKITIDEDKIWWRYHDDARSQYANTIDKVQQMYSAGDYAGMYKTINDFDSRMANYTQATTQKNEWKKSVEKGDKYYDQNYLNQLENRDFDMKDLASLADQSGFGMYDENTNILGFINPTDRVDLRASMKKAIEGQKFEYDKAGKKLDVVGYGANREPVYRMSLQDKDNTINAVKNSISPQAVPYMLMELGYSKEDQTKMTPAELTQTLDQELDKVYGLYATQEKMGAKPTGDGGGFSFNVGGGRSEGSIFNNSGGRELKLEGGEAIKTTGQYDITFTKGTGRTTLSVPSGSYVLNPTTGEYKETDFTGSLDEAIPLYPMVGEDGQEWYAAISKGSVSDVDPNVVLIVTNLLSSGDPGDAAEAQKILDKSKYGQTYLIKGNDSVKNQFWGKVLGQDYTKQRANDAMKKLGAGLPDF
jgi:hypothetical protein